MRSSQSHTFSTPTVREILPTGTPGGATSSQRELVIASLPEAT